MKQISRETADKLVAVFQPLEAKIDQDSDRLCIMISLSNGQILQVIQTRKKFNKTYYINKEQKCI